MPREAELPARLGPVLAVVYLIYTSGHSATGGEAVVAGELCDEAVRLARVLADLLPDEAEVLGLLALLLLLESRRAARTGPAGELVPLSEQDRSRWDGALIAEGQDRVRALLRRGRPGPYQVQAAIQPFHAVRADLLTRLDRGPEAVAEYEQALALTGNAVERAHPQRRRDAARCSGGISREPGAGLPRSPNT